MGMKKALFRLCLIALTLSLDACSATGIRKLSEIESNYFSLLRTHLQDSTPKLKHLLEKRTATNEEAALIQVAQLDDNIRRAKLVYTLREVLTAPAGDSASFIQVTRNKVLLYHLAEAGQARNVKLGSEVAKGADERRQLISDLQGLSKLVTDVIASNEVLQNYLNESGTSQLTELMGEVGRQVVAYNQGIQAGDQNNPAIQQMVEVGKAADQRVKEVENQLSNFIKIWSMLNDTGK